MVQPAHVEPDLRVLLAIDPVQDAARDLVAVPRDLPQRGVDVGMAEHVDEVLLVPDRGLPVIPKRIRVGHPDRAVVLRPDRADLQAVGQRRLRDRQVERAAHHEPVAHGRIAGARRERGACGVALLAAAAQHVG